MLLWPSSSSFESQCTICRLRQETSRHHNSSLEKRTAVRPQARGCRCDLERPVSTSLAPVPSRPSWTGTVWTAAGTAASGDSGSVGARRLRRGQPAPFVSGFLEAFLHFSSCRPATSRVTSLLMTKEGMSSSHWNPRILTHT